MGGSPPTSTYLRGFVSGAEFGEGGRVTETRKIRKADQLKYTTKVRNPHTGFCKKKYVPKTCLYIYGDKTITNKLQFHTSMNTFCPIEEGVF